MVRGHVQRRIRRIRRREKKVLIEFTGPLKRGPVDQVGVEVSW